MCYWCEAAAFRRDAQCKHRQGYVRACGAWRCARCGASKPPDTSTTFKYSKCHYCGKLNAGTRDHVVPWSLGGVNAKDNLVPACRECNNAKSNQLPDCVCPFCQNALRKYGPGRPGNRFS